MKLGGNVEKVAPELKSNFVFYYWSSLSVFPTARRHNSGLMACVSVFKSHYLMHIIVVELFARTKNFSFISFISKLYL